MNPFKDFLKTQWFIGIQGGTNITQALPTQEFMGITNVNLEEATKTYTNFSLAGTNAGLNLTFYYKGLSIGTTPGWRQMRFEYNLAENWVDNTGATAMTMDYHTDHRLDYFELPLFVRYDILKQPLKPYVMAGVFQGYRVNAVKSMQVTYTDLAFSPPQVSIYPPTSANVDPSFQRSYTGLLAGIGIGYDLDSNVRASLEVNYRESLGNVIDPSHRFSETTFSGFGDIFDDMRLRNLSINVSLLFPLRYISSDFKSF